jgi:DNA-binding beta-propeller fold protein YncE
MIFQLNLATGVLTQLTGSAGCISSNGVDQDANTCQTDATLGRPLGVSLSPDGNFVYVTDYSVPKLIHVFARDVMTGALTEVQCLCEARAPSGCVTGRVLGYAQSLVVAADGTHAYDGDFYHGLSVFDRNPATGILTQKPGTAGCITDNGPDDTGASTCAVGRVMAGDYPLTLAPNGQTLFVPASFLSTGSRSSTLTPTGADPAGRDGRVYHVQWAGRAWPPDVCDGIAGP